MTQRTKYLLNSIPVLVTTHFDGSINLIVRKAYKELSTIEGRGFGLNDNNQIVCTCSKKDYGKKIKELTELLIKIESINKELRYKSFNKGGLKPNSDNVPEITQLPDSAKVVTPSICKQIAKKALKESNINICNQMEGKLFNVGEPPMFKSIPIEEKKDNKDDSNDSSVVNKPIKKRNSKKYRFGNNAGNKESK